MKIPLKLKSFGEKNPDKKFFVIWRRNSKAGFFSNLFCVCAQLEIAEKYGLIPVIDMENYPMFYNEQSSVCDTRNSWEYYFAQPTPFSLDEIYQSKNVYLCNGESIKEVYLRFKNFEYGNSILKKYIKINPNILAAVDNFSNTFFRGNILGVQFRGQEMKTAAYHVTPPTVAQMVKTTKEMIKKYEIDKVFLVTEDKGYLAIFQKEFGDMLLYTDSFRTYEGENSYTINPPPRNLHMYNLGLEVLIDMLLLSKTNYLLASGQDGLAYGSNVCLMAQIFNNNKYRHVETIFNGVNPEIIEVKGMLKHILPFACKIKNICIGRS